MTTLTTTTSETMTDSSITMMTDLGDHLSSAVVELPAVESVEAPGDLASHGERATTLATQVSEKDTTKATEKITSQLIQATEKVTLAIQASEKALDTEWHRKLTFLSRFSRNLQDLEESVSICEHFCLLSVSQ